MSKTEYMAVNSSASFQIPISNKQVKQVDHFKYLSVTKEEGTREIKKRIEQGRKIIECLNSI